MKKLSQKLALAFIGLLTITSCRLDPPPVPDYVGELNALLPAIQSSTAHFNGSELGRFQLIWMQQLGGYRSNDLEIDKYMMTSRHAQDAWTNFYISQNMILPRIISLFFSAEQIDANAFSGINRVLASLNVGLMTDTYGDMPRDKAVAYVQGFSSVEYDQQSLVYDFILDQLNKAVIDLSNANLDPDSLKPTTSDKMYGGNLNKWMKAANVLKARYLLRIAHRQNNYNIVKTHLESAALMIGNQDDLQYVYSGNERNPFYLSVTQGQNSRVGKFMADKMVETGDPRLPIFLKKSTLDLSYFGTAPGEANVHASYIGTGLSSMLSPTNLVTYVEQKFIEAEVYHRTGEQGLADLAFDQAVRASLQKFGVSHTEWENQHASITNVSLEQIINAKYVALFLNPEVWTDFRRTGYPALTPYVNPDGNGDDKDEENSEIPRRFLYPQSEISGNSNNVPQDVTIYTRMWWDE